MGKLRNIVLGKTCGMCGRRGSDVITYKAMAMDLHSGCKRKLSAADRSAPPGSRAAGYRAASGQPIPLAGPMGGRYRGPEPPPQRRK